MVSYFFHKKFWMPLLLLLLMSLGLELLFRSQIYDPLISPKSLLGTSKNRVNALKEHGLNNIHWLTVGDSKIDWGLEHQDVQDHQAMKGIHHLRFSIPGANILTYQTSIEWAIDHMPDLEGVALGLYETELFSFSNVSKAYKIAAPFDHYIDPSKYTYHKKQKTAFLYWHQLELGKYFADFKKLLQNPVKRWFQFKKQAQSMKSKLNHVKKSQQNLCALNLQSLNSCYQSAQQLKGQKVPIGLAIPVQKCSKEDTLLKIEKGQTLSKIKNIQPHLKNWRTLIEKILKSDKKIIFFLFPENEFYDYSNRPLNAHVLVNQLLGEFEHHPNFIFYDLRQAFKGHKQCEVYADTLHFNSKGITIITPQFIQALDDLERFINQDTALDNPSD